MSQRPLSPKIRQMSELLYAEIVGRLHACAHLENGAERVEDPRVLYGWNLLTQEVLIRLAEASLKLLHLVHFNKPPERVHALADLWAQLPAEVRDAVEAKRRCFAGGERGVSFAEYDMADFQNVRYSYERLMGGQTLSFETRRLFYDAFATRDLAEEWLGEIRVWPWAGMTSPTLAGYKIIPVTNGTFEVVIEDPIEPMDWAGAVIEVQGNQYVWTLYCGFTDEAGNDRSFEIPALLYPGPIQDLFADSVERCVEKVYRAYSEPCVDLQKAVQEATISKQ